MKNLKISGGILPLFRTFVFIRLVWGVFTLLFTFGRSNDFLVWGSVLGVGECFLLLGYLSWPGLDKKMGNYYLPLGLFIVTLGPWVESLITFLTFPTNMAQFPPIPGMNITIIFNLLVLATQMQLAFVLFIPLIFISWQYSLKWVIYYSLGIALLEFAQLLIVWYRLQDKMSADQGPSGTPGTLILMTGLFLMTGYMVNRLSFEQKEHNRQLSHYAATLEHLTTSRERNRLAREIHDTLAHTLSGLAVNLEAVTALWENDPSHAKDILNQSLSVTRNGLVETRRAIQALRAGPLDDLGLSLALKQLALSSADRYSLKPDIHLPDQLDGMEPAVEQCIYRIVEEGLRNTCQHAKASLFSLSLSREGQAWVLILSDDGCGFDSHHNDPGEHFGIKGMKERAETVGGVLNINTQPGKGTTIKLVIEGMTP
jgi:signal transduction histidine kinase